MVKVWVNRLTLGFVFALVPALLVGCGGKEEPKTEVKAPEVVDVSKETPTATPVVEEPAEEEIAAEEPSDEGAMEESAEEPEEVVPELLSSNDEVLIFFPSIQLGASLDMLVHAFFQENYMHLELMYVGDDEALLAEYEDNVLFTGCKSEELEGLVIASAVNREDNYGVIIFGEEGKVSSYVLPETSTHIKTPEDYPPLSANFTPEDNMRQLLALVEALRNCGVNL